MTPNTGYRYKELSKKLYKVRVPSIATYSDAELKRSGMLPVRVLGSSEPYGSELLAQIEQQSPLAQETTIMINISRMIDIYIKGFPIKVINENDVIDIYNQLEDYFSGSATETDQIFNVRKYYDDKLPIIDRFLTDIFSQHKIAIGMSKIRDMSQSRFAGTGFMGYVPLRPAEKASRNTGTSFNDRQVQSTGIIAGHNVGYMQMQTTAATELRKPMVEMKTEAKVLEGNYVNKYEPQLNLERLQDLKRPSKPAIDLDKYRNKQ